MSSEVKILMEPGHYYSPIVDPAQIKQLGYFERQKERVPLDLRLDYKGMLKKFSELIQIENGDWMPREKQDKFRYYSENDYYRFGDAVILSGIIQAYNPRRIIEVGSGYSSAVILDTLDLMDRLSKDGTAAKDRYRRRTQCTFIEPYPERLEKLLYVSDANRVKIIRKFIQDIDLEEFSALKAGDLIFFDTTHVSKTCSDVNFEVFDILPRLAPGVVIHFHDVFHNFEYPEYWVFDDNRSWNEIYLLRAFLMNNADYDIAIINDSIGKLFSDEVSRISPRFMENAGGGLWMVKN